MGHDKTNKLSNVAKLLKLDKERLIEFDNIYKNKALVDNDIKDNFFDNNSRDMSKQVRGTTLKDDIDFDRLQEVTNRIVGELVSTTQSIDIDNQFKSWQQYPLIANSKPVTNEELKEIDISVRPQLTGSLVWIDLKIPSYQVLLEKYNDILNSKSKQEKEINTAMFRQGLDILDLDPITYEMLSMNKNSMSHWLPQISESVNIHKFFKIPKTKIVKVPLPILQLTRIAYSSINVATLKIIDDWAMRVFDLDVTKSYFIKTGTYSSKFDFRNCVVKGKEEVETLGEYLLFIHNQACMMAGPLTKPRPLIGASTTNEWVVREFIEDVENNPTIYKGLPLHTEYRVFVDFDAKEILGYTPYWYPEGMKKHFKDRAKTDDNFKHDYIVFEAYEDTLMDRYNSNIDNVIKHVEELLPDTKLEGQWSIDIMQNGDDFWLIDMALANQSALKECVPEGRLKSQEEFWIPDVSEIKYLEGRAE